MEWDDLERHFSSARLGRYCAKQNGDKSKAAADYLYNILLAEALFPMLNLVEISFRNAVNTKLNERYKEPAWWNSIKSVFHNLKTILINATLTRRVVVRLPMSRVLYGHHSGYETVSKSREKS